MKAKKLLALLLSVILCVCVFPITASAEGDEVTVIDLSTITADSQIDGVQLRIYSGVLSIILNSGRFSFIASTGESSAYSGFDVFIGSGVELCDSTPAASNLCILIMYSGIISGGIYMHKVRGEASDDNGLYFHAPETHGVFSVCPTWRSNDGDDDGIIIYKSFDNIHALTVGNGCVTGTEDLETPLTSGWASEGYDVPITADEPAEGMVFDCWTGVDENGDEIVFADAYSASTTFTMPANDATVTANYRTASISGDIDDDGKVAMTDAVELVGAIINCKKDDKYDYNGDGRVNYRDAVDYITWLCENYPEIAPLDYFDMNGNGKIDAIDILMIIFSFRSWCGAIN